MGQGILYGVGVGPGDPELLTLKAARILREADVVAVPDKGSGKKTALEIVAAHVEGKQLVYCDTPMTRDAARLEDSYRRGADRLCALLDKGKTVAFITLGDPAIYSTYIYLHRKVTQRGYRAELVPGVPSFCAAAARLGVSLCQGDERLLIVPASHCVEDCLDFPANQVYMKAGRNVGALRDALAARGRLEKAAAVCNCGMEGEKICPALADMREEDYFSVVLVRGRQQ
ncbi:precorrin-2 C(20)-methyltransferase [Pseudoflavonifractor sp. 524-17]|uniref:precorrin-2 C(20)-methyltransferase n=1 Tax=Pseudoflavonifractor sp. 524-17 TaxID=2304577 RepID=UPI00137A6618|nr:precorrin-2 C(20)-methyltransferase [Pseudoflavonifractor sp. 524-17]NCE63237.1 precorrin-2 C(20)-methyltransferase [Pseudoflavonifractor sp. 524-17]